MLTNDKNVRVSFVKNKKSELKYKVICIKKEAISWKKEILF